MATTGATPSRNVEIATELASIYDRSLEVNSLIELFRHIDPELVDEGHWSFGMRILFRMSDELSNSLDKLAFDVRKSVEVCNEDS